MHGWDDRTPTEIGRSSLRVRTPIIRSLNGRSIGAVSWLAESQIEKSAGVEIQSSQGQESTQLGHST